MWHLPILGIAHASPALAGGFLTMEPPGHIWDSSFPHTYLVKEARIKRHGSWESSATALVCYPKLWGLWWAAQLPWDCFLPSEMPCFWTVAHQAPLSLGFLRPEYCRWCHFLLCCCCHVASVVPDSARPHRQQPTRLLCPLECTLTLVLVVFFFLFISSGKGNKSTNKWVGIYPTKKLM